jgi:hypothetical protein
MFVLKVDELGVVFIPALKRSGTGSMLEMISRNRSDTTLTSQAILDHRNIPMSLPSKSLRARSSLRVKVY